ncbi:vWA domain-containing protein [Isoptericola sp. b408]|uniref:vWA domain-containing protein n=1 Tax=Isoptericola sp. b408 TaxID=3064653 RepID=UPI002712CE19|nr:vWA domain-containing protein [Isoptericola sp. b408]MDO8151723.1 vWA domain-containing protein [Isoptericola sp. b408]
MAAAGVMMAGYAVAGTDSTTLANGADLSVTVSTPTTGDTFLVPTGSTTVDVPVEGSASIGEGEPNVHWTYVVDVSGSTGAGCGSVGGTVLDCEKQAVTNLNNAVVADGSGKDVGVSVFGRGGASADMSGAAGNQPIVAPDDPGVDVVIGSIVIGGVNLYTPRAVNPNDTNFSAGLTAAGTSVSASTAASKNVVFLSDGESNLGGGNFNAAVAALDSAGATIYSFAVGSGASCAGGSDGTLQAMADATGGTCTNVPNPATLPDIVQNVTDTAMTDVALEVDTVSTSFDTLTQTPPFDGPGSTDFTATAADQAPGAHEVCASATGTGPKSDASSEQTVTQCETYDVYAFSLTPETATNELGSDNEHTVTATVDGPAGKLAGWPVEFAVTGQNAGASGTCAPASCETDADGEVTFTYSVPVEPNSLGTDTISATVTVNSDSATVDVTKEWVDTTPPTATCEPGPNSGGQIPAAPGEGGQGQNQDGFYTITATDDVWGAESLDVFVIDDGTGTVFGPYANPTNLKWTEANGADPIEKAGSGAVDWALKGQGDAQITAVDGSGNVSDPVACLVPPAPQ